MLKVNTLDYGDVEGLVPVNVDGMAEVVIPHWGKLLLETENGEKWTIEIPASTTEVMVRVRRYVAIDLGD